MRRGTVVRAGASLVVVGALAAGAVSSGLLGPLPANGGEATAPAAESTDRSTVAVERRTLTVEETLDGTLGYTGEAQVLNGLSGTLTRVPALGTILERGDTLYEVDGSRRPVLLYGTRPAWRTLEPDMSSGADVKQLEENLRALGYASDGMKVDRHWTDATTAAVERWQDAMGMDDDGSIEVGEIVFLPGSIRVTERPAAVGQRVGPGQVVLAGTRDERVVTVSLAAARVDLVEVGSAVSVELPDGSVAAGTVTEVGTVAEAATDEFGGQADPTVEVTIEVELPDDTASYEQAPVEVRITRQSREDVLAVPVNALIALLEGGYAVEVVADDGTTRLVGVELGLFQDGWVEIRADGLDAGEDVAVPS